jgi:hypothetical protein
MKLVEGWIRICSDDAGLCRVSHCRAALAQFPYAQIADPMFSIMEVLIIGLKPAIMVSCPKWLGSGHPMSAQCKSRSALALAAPML